MVQAVENRRFARSRLRKVPEHLDHGRILVVVPCKGLDVGMDENLRPLFEQDYPDYELRFVVESAEDPACDSLRRLMHRHCSIPAQVVIAGEAIDCGQKVHNLRRATAELESEIRVLVFVDSDARPNRDWLRRLTARIERAEVGAVSGYRWFVPQRANLASHLLYGINSAIAQLLGPGGHHLVWGGSWAIRREVFEAIDLRRAWDGTLSDDLVASRAIHQAGLRVEFEPSSIVASPLDCTLGEMTEFVRRQYIMAKIYAPNFWRGALLGSTLSNVVAWGSLGGAIHGATISAWWTWPAAALWCLLCTGQVVRAALRQSVAWHADSRQRAQLARARRFDVLLAPIVILVNWLGLVARLTGNRVTWRGIQYRIQSDGRVKLLSRDGAAGRPIYVEPVDAPVSQTRPPAPASPATPTKRTTADKVTVG